MLKSIIWRATVVAMLATVVAMPGVGLAQELRPRQASAEQDGRVPPRERPGRPDRPGEGRDVSRPEVRRCIQAVKENGGDRDDMRRCLAHVNQNDVTRPEVRRCMEAVKEHGGDRDDMRRCLAQAHGDEVTRSEVRRCIEAVKEHGGDRSDLRRCLAMAHEGDAPAPTAGPTSVLERAPEAPAPTAAPSSILERVPEPVSP